MSKTAPAPAIHLRGVRHNNLKNFDLDLPLRRLIVFTGLSGSGKSSLAFDTLYAEGQRRYIETFSPYARQFFDRMDKPQVDAIEGIPPAIAIEQRNSVRTTRSTVGTMTEICDHLKVLWPHIAQLHCRGCGQPVRKEPPQEVWRRVVDDAGCRMPGADAGATKAGASEVFITFNLPLSEKLSIADSLALLQKQGYQRLLVDGEILRLDEAEARLAPGIRPPASGVRHLTIIQDRLRCAPANRARFIEACEQAYHFGKGRLTVWEVHPPSSILHPRRFSATLHCARCDLDYREPSPALFSFNHPVGACPTCKGFGRVIGIDYDLALPDRSLTLADGAVKPWRSGFSAECQADMRKFCKLRSVPMNVPFRDLPQWQQDWVTLGDKDYGIDEDHQWPRAWYGIKGYFKWLESKAYKMHVRVLLSRYRSYTKCPDCEGARFQKDALLYLLRVGQASRLSPASSDQNSETGATPVLLSLADFYALPVDRALATVEAVAAGPLFAGKNRSTIGIVLQEVISRLRFLREVGLGYLTLDRPTRTLSGGETERVNLTTCLGTRLVNTLYVLDEPSVGLHPRDTAQLVRILEKLRDAGNTVVVVEHEPGVMRAADEIVDLGPGHGESGGQVVFQGTLRDLLKCEASLTGRYLSGRMKVEVRERRRVPVENPKSEKVPTGGSVRISDFGLPSDFGFRISDFPHLSLHHATRHNLKDLSVNIPLSRFVCLTGVSGSGKTTLVRDVLLPALQEKLHVPAETAKASDRADVESDDRAEDESAIRSPKSAAISGFEHLGRVLMVDQTSLGKTPRSNPAVYVGAFDHIREVFAQTETARQRGLNASAFSFNSAQGQCERCRGAGFEKIEMQFLSDIFIRCPDCAGRRYRGHILDVKIAVPEGEVRSPKSEVRSAPKPAPEPARAWSIADVLDATVDETVRFLQGFPGSKPAARACAALTLLQDVGLGYLRLGQPINTLSGGESQRLKLAAHLAEAAQRRTGIAPVSDLEKGKASAEKPSLSRTAPEDARDRRDACPTFFIFDEPTTGLHFEDVRVLLLVFQRLVDAGHSVLVIEHNLEVIKCADWVIDLGPEAGEGGGRLVAAGTPEDIAACDGSHTGKFLRQVLPNGQPIQHNPKARQ